jgi:hypothetical protein
MISVEFKSKLANGREVFVMARVGESVEIDHVMTSDDCDAVDVDLKALSRADLIILEEDAAEEFYELQRQWKAGA